MKQYGWFPIQEFMELPLPLFWGLLHEIELDGREEEKALRKK